MFEKKKLSLAVFGAVCCLPTVVTAGGNQVDIYHLGADLEARPGGDADGDGVGLKGRLALGDDGGFFSFEYQDAEVDPGASDFGFVRLGFGTAVGMSEAVDFSIGIELVQTEFAADKQRGIGFHAGVDVGLSRALTGVASVGLVDLGLGDGNSAMIGARYAVSEAFSLFADYRIHNLEDDAQTDLTFSELRVGVGLKFGNMAPPASKPAMDSKPVAAAKPMPVPAAPAPEPLQPADPLEGVTTAVFDWARAWSAQDVERYLSAYAPEFMPSGSMSRTAWVKLRRQRVSAPSRINVEVIAPKAEATGPDTARVRFTQAYESNTYEDRGIKVLDLKKIAGRWLIIREATR